MGNEDTHEIEKAILKVVGDEYARKILMATIREAKSAAELSMQLGIPIATVYRKIGELLRQGLLIREKSRFTEKAKWVDLYRSTLRSIDIHLSEKGIIVKYQPNLDLVNRLALLWNDLKSVRP